MARIPNTEVERLKQGVSVQRLVEARGVELKKHGADLIGRCPFHDDRTPSLVVSPGKNLWHCLGACQAGGSVIDWVMKAEGVSFRHAVELLRGDLPAVTAPASTISARPAVKASTVRKLPAPLDASAEDQELLRQVVAYYHESLKQSPEALGYLEKRGLRSSEMVERFQLGFANRTLGYRLPAKNRQAGEAIRGRLTTLGIYRESGHEHLNGSLVIPVFDEAGCVVEMYGRKITHGLKKGIPLHLYLPGPHRGVFNLEAIASSPEVILCESLIDALSFWCAGYRNVTASYGVEGFTADHLEAFRKHKTERVLIAYDRDEAGDKAALKLAEKLAAENITSYRVLFPRGMDANEYALKLTPAEKSLGLALRKAEWMRKGKAPPVTLGLPVAAAPATTPTKAEPTPATVAPRKEMRSVRPWDEWHRHALDVGVGAELAELGRQVMREAEQHGWDDELAALCGVDDGGAAMLELALANPARAAASWQKLLDQDGLADDDTDEDDDELDQEDEEDAARVAPPKSTASATPASPPAPVPPPMVEPLPLVASPEPPPPKAPLIEPELRGEEVVFTLGDRRYRVRGLGRNLSLEQLRVNMLAGRGEAFFVDTLDLYSARQRQSFIAQAAGELGVEQDVIKRDLGKVLLALEDLQEKQVEEAQKPKERGVTLSDSETEAALELLRDPGLLARILGDFARCGVVGEETNKLVGYLGAVSRKLDEPLAIIIQSSSAAGKSSLMDAILAFVPNEERVQYSAMTGQSLFYMGESDLRHKVLAIVEEQGAERASYALKLLQSEGELTIASTGKDPASGRLITQEYRVEGPVMIFLTTTAIEIDEELLNRCLVLTVDEDRAQTQAIHQKQRQAQTLAGLLAKKERDGVLKLHRDAQRLLRPLLVANPFAERLTFIDDRTRTRRDHMKYLTLIRSIALLHQYQREHKTVEHEGQKLTYIEVTVEDIEVANRLAHQVLGRSLDELPPQTRRLLLLLDEMVTAACKRLAMDRSDYRFTRREVREAIGWGNTQLKVHLARLEEMEYLALHRGGKAGGFVYELRYDGEGKDGRPFLVGLADPAQLRTYDETRSGANGERSGSGRPLVGPKSGSGRPTKTDLATTQTARNRPNGRAALPPAHLDEVAAAPSYVEAARIS
jgi:DNA primase catalytic core